MLSVKRISERTEPVVIVSAEAGMLGYSLILDCVKQFEYLAWLPSSYLWSFSLVYGIYNYMEDFLKEECGQELSVQLHKVFSCAKLCSET